MCQLALVAGGDQSGRMARLSFSDENSGENVNCVSDWLRPISEFYGINFQKFLNKYIKNGIYVIIKFENTIFKWKKSLKKHFIPSYAKDTYKNIEIFALYLIESSKSF